LAKSSHCALQGSPQHTLSLLVPHAWLFLASERLVLVVLWIASNASSELKVNASELKGAAVAILAEKHKAMTVETAVAMVQVSVEAGIERLGYWQRWLVAYAAHVVMDRAVMGKAMTLVTAATMATYLLVRSGFAWSSTQVSQW
jgi:hypothetical protein